MADNDPGDWIKTPVSVGAGTIGGAVPSQEAAPGQDWIKTSSHPEGDVASEQLYRDLSTQPRGERPSGEDIQQGIAHGLVSGSSQILGFPADAWNLLKDENKWLITKGAEQAGLISPETGERIRQSTWGTNPVTSEWIAEHIKALARRSGRDTSAVQTVPGKYAETITSFLPTAAAIPIGAGQAASRIPGALLKYGMIPGAASETAGQATEGTAAESYARVAGAVTPALAGSALTTGRRAMNPMRRSLDNVTDAQATEAQALLDESRAVGMPVTVPEAIDKTTGRATNIGDIARVTEQSPLGGPAMKAFYAERPGQVEAGGRGALDQIAPGTVPTTEIGPRVQGAANEVVSEANASRTAAVDPFYQAAGTDRVPLTDMHAFLGRIDRMIASDKTGILGPELSDLRNRLTESPAKAAIPAVRVARQTPTGATIWSTIPGTPAAARVPVTDIENLDRARKYFRDRLDQPQWAQDAISKEEGAKIGSLLGDLRQKMISSSADFSTGKNTYQTFTERDFNPLVRSPTGQLAKTEGWEKQADIILSNNPDPRSHLAVGKAVRDVAGKDPEAAQELVRARLEKTFNEATQSNVPGPNQWGAPKFAATVMGNSQQAKNLESAMRALPNGDTRWAAFDRTMDIFKAMGTRHPVGSQTAFNAQMNEWIKAHPNSLPVDFVAAAATPGKWLTSARGLYHDFAYGQKTGQLAKVFTEGNVSDLRAIVGAPARSARGQAALVSLLAREGASGATEAP